MNNIKVVCESEEIKNTEDIISEAIEKAHKNFSPNKISDFIEKYIYFGNGHILVIEALIENGFYKEAREYFKMIVGMWVADFNGNAEEMVENTIIPMGIGMEEIDRGINLIEWTNQYEDILMKKGNK